MAEENGSEGGESQEAQVSVATPEPKKSSGEIGIHELAKLIAERRQKAAKPEGEAPEDANEGGEAEPEGEEVPKENVEHAPKEKKPSDKSEVLSQPNEKQKDKGRFQQRIDKLSAEAKAAEEKRLAAEAVHAREMQALRAEIEAMKTAKADQPVPTSYRNGNHSDDLSYKCRTHQDLDGLHRQSMEAFEWADDLLGNPEKLEQERYDGKPVSLEQVRATKKAAWRHLNEYIPQRRAFINKKFGVEDVVRKVFPDMFDPEKEVAKLRDGAYKEYSFLQDLPNADEIIMYQILGRQKYAEIAAAQREPQKEQVKAETKRTAPKTGEEGASAPPIPSRAPAGKVEIQKQLAKAEETLKKTGSPNDLSKVLALRRQLST